MSTSAKKLAALEQLVGNTPMAEIRLKYRGKERKVYAKLEYYNFSGSIKDRMALNCFKRAYEDGTIKEGYTIAETTSGNTGIAFCAQGSFLGHPSVIFMPDWMSAERKLMIAGFGAKLELVSREQGGFLKCLDLTAEMGKQDGIFLADQFANPYNTQAHYTSTGPEILKQMDKLGAQVHGVVAGVGTGGTIMGIGRYLRSVDRRVKMFPMEPESSPTLSTGYQIGKHRIAGISDEFIPAIMDLDECDDIIMVDDGDAIIATQMLAKQLGMGVGISSGANLLAAIKGGDLIGADANIVTVFSDDNKKYLSTDYAKQEPVKEGFLSSELELLDFVAVR